MKTITDPSDEMESITETYVYYCSPLSKIKERMILVEHKESTSTVKCLKSGGLTVVLNSYLEF